MTGELQDKITGFWSAVAGGYEAHAGNVPAQSSEEQQAWGREIADLLPPTPADVLDAGTGTGFVALIAAALGRRVTAIDLAEPMLSIARAETEGRRVPVTFATGDAVSPAFAAASFDAIISRHLIWTLRDIDVALTAWRRLLRPGGRSRRSTGPRRTGHHPSPRTPSSALSAELAGRPGVISRSLTRQPPSGSPLSDAPGCGTEWPVRWC